MNQKKAIMWGRERKGPGWERGKGQSEYDQVLEVEWGKKTEALGASRKWKQFIWGGRSWEHPNQRPGRQEPSMAAFSEAQQAAERIRCRNLPQPMNRS